jgi:hypothetical protein
VRQPEGEQPDREQPQQHRPGPVGGDHARQRRAPCAQPCPGERREHRHDEQVEEDGEQQRADRPRAALPGDRQQLEQDGVDDDRDAERRPQHRPTQPPAQAAAPERLDLVAPNGAHPLGG